MIAADSSHPSPVQAPPAVTVVICTHNRAHYLKQSIRSALEQTAATRDFEVLVVDNRSTDETKAVVESLQSAANLRYLYEPRLGLCHARNAGWRDAAGRYVAYLDDDAVASTEWVSAIIDGFASDANVGIVGGRVEPIWEAERPVWLSDDIALSLTVLDWSDRPKVITDARAEWLVGANLAAPRAVLEEVGGFEPRLDRVGRRMISSGDVFLQKQIMARGYTCLYFPRMSVKHLVPAARLRQAWFRHRYYWQGISDVVMQLIEENPSRGRRIGLAAAKAAALLGSPRMLRGLLVPTRDPRVFTDKCFAWILVGRMMGLLGAAHRA